MTDDLSALAEEMAVQLIVDDLGELMVPEKEARQRAEAHRTQRTQSFLELHHRAVGIIGELNHRGLLRKGDNQ